MSLREPIAIISLVLLSSICFGAQSSAVAQSGSTDAALKYLDSIDRDASYSRYVDLLVPVVVQSFRSKRPDLSEACWNSFGEILRSELVAHDQDLKRISVESYARHFTDDELTELESFESSNVGRQYRKAVRDLIADAVRSPKNAAPFIEGVQKIVADQSPKDAVSRFPVLLTALRGRLSEQEIRQTATFFFNGVGKKYLEATPEINAEIIRGEADFIAADTPKIKKAWAESGNCK